MSWSLPKLLLWSSRTLTRNRGKSKLYFSRRNARSSIWLLMGLWPSRKLCDTRRIETTVVYVRLSKTSLSLIYIGIFVIIIIVILITCWIKTTVINSWCVKPSVISTAFGKNKWIFWYRIIVSCSGSFIRWYWWKWCGCCRMVCWCRSG